MSGELSSKTRVPAGWLIAAIMATATILGAVYREALKIDARLVRIETVLHLQQSEASAPHHHESEL